MYPNISRVIDEVTKQGKTLTAVDIRRGYALYQADVILSCYNLKDLADMLIGGYEPITLKSIEEGLRITFEEMAETGMDDSEHELVEFIIAKW